MPFKEFTAGELTEMADKVLKARNVTENEITVSLLKSLFDYRDGKLYWKISRSRRIKIGDEAGSLHKNYGYWIVGIGPKTYRRNRLIFLMLKGYLPRIVDHIDRNRVNDKIENLRESNHLLNAMNSPIDKTNKSGYKGVCFDKKSNKWVAYIKYGKSIYLGAFENKESAAIAYNNAAFSFYGEHAFLNTIIYECK